MSSQGTPDYFDDDSQSFDEQFWNQAAKLLDSVGSAPTPALSSPCTESSLSTSSSSMMSPVTTSSQVSSESRQITTPITTPRRKRAFARTTSTPEGRRAAICGERIRAQTLPSIPQSPSSTPRNRLPPKYDVTISDDDDDDDAWAQTISPFTVSRTSTLVNDPMFAVDVPPRRLESVSAVLSPKRKRCPSTESNSPTKKSPRLGSDMQFRVPLDEPNIFNPDPAIPEGTHVRPLVDLKAMMDYSVVLDDDTIGTNLMAVQVAHDKSAQTVFDKYNVPWGTQWEFARGVTMKQWSWSDVFNKLRGSRALNFSNDASSAPRVREYMLGNTSNDRADVSVWAEMDREQAALVENKGRGLGLMGEWHGCEKWFGGQIRQTVDILDLNDGVESFRLGPITTAKRSYRLARQFGSRRILQLKIRFKQNRDQLADYLMRRKFVICGRVFVPLTPKDNKIYLIETSENFDRQSSEFFGDHLRLSFNRIIESLNPMSLNGKQPVAKWAARFTLLLSTSVPAVAFEPENMYLIDDVYADGDRSKTEKNMTDGCGFINHTALKAIVEEMPSEHITEIPTAVQGRIAGAKGMWTLHPYDTHDQPHIWIRESQHKIALPALKREHCILDLLHTSRPTGGSVFLSAQSVQNLSHNGCPDQLLIDLSKETLREWIEPMLTWTGDNAMVKLCSFLDRWWGISQSRRVRQAQEFARLLQQRLADDDVLIEDDDDEDAVSDRTRSQQTGRSFYSRAPLAFAEQAYELILANFEPRSCAKLSRLLRDICETKIDGVIDKCRLPLPESQGFSAYAIPDPYGVLQEEEIFYRPSRPGIDPVTKMRMDVLQGEVIVGRYPVRLPSDMQRVKAVDHEKLRRYCDVVIVPVQGSCSLVSLLGGGDCDGDILFILRLSGLVEHFQNKRFSEPPGQFMEDYFEREVKRVPQFCEEMKNAKNEDLQQRDEALQKVLLLDLPDLKVGIYSKMHDNATKKFGYDAAETIRLAHMFTTLLDAPKTGLRVKPHVFADDCRAHLQDPKRTKPGILDRMLEQGKTMKTEILAQHDNLAGRNSGESPPPDPILLNPWNAALSMTKRSSVGVYNEDMNALRPLRISELDRMRAHVEKCRHDWDAKCRKSQENKENGAKRSSGYSDAMLSITKTFHSFDTSNILLYSDTDARRLMASYAYTLNTNFGFSMDFHRLCQIKAESCDAGAAPVRRDFDELRTFPSSATKQM